VVNHLRRRTRFNGLGSGFGQRLETRAQPLGADPHATWCGRGPGQPGPYPDPLFRRHGISGSPSVRFDVRHPRPLQSSSIRKTPRRTRRARRGQRTYRLMPSFSLVTLKLIN
jgi:hypothetical protein